ncbi:MAG: hypothetical protein AAFY00_12335, partial [Bacteroidota bacterium]
MSITHNGCTSLENPNVTLIDPITPTIEVTDFSNPTTCGGDDGQIVLRITGVNNNFYNIVYDGGVFNNVFVNGSADFARIDNVPQGTYDNLNITVSGCTSIENPDVTLIDPNAPDINPIENQQVCNEFILPPITGSDLTGNETYYDAPNGGGTQYLAGESITTSGTYYMYDENGTCSDEESFLISVQNLSVSIETNNELCLNSNNGSIDFSINNGVAPYQVEIDGVPVTTLNNASGSIDDLAPSSYVLSITDALGCEVTEVFEIDSDGVNLNAIVTPIYSCDSGVFSNSLEVSLLDSSVSSEVLYALDSTNPQDFVLTLEFGNISLGNHFLSILHINGCLVSIPFTIDETIPLELNLSNSSTNQITADAFGGNPPYTYFFDNESGSSDNTFSISIYGK